MCGVLMCMIHKDVAMSLVDVTQDSQGRCHGTVIHRDVRRVPRHREFVKASKKGLIYRRIRSEK